MRTRIEQNADNPIWSWILKLLSMPRILVLWLYSLFIRTARHPSTQVNSASSTTTDVPASPEQALITAETVNLEQFDTLPDVTRQHIASYLPLSRQSVLSSMSKDSQNPSSELFRY